MTTGRQEEIRWLMADVRCMRADDTKTKSDSWFMVTTGSRSNYGSWFMVHGSW
jgi:hypothetical protein